MASKTANVLARVEPSVKEQAESIMSQLGIPVSVVINMLYKQIILTKSIPFSLALPSRPLRVLARLAVCSAAAVLLYGLALRLMGLTEEIAAWYVNALLLAAGNAVFLLTDATLARLTGVWHWKLKKHLYR